MLDQALTALLTRHPHGRLLRFLTAAQGGLAVSLLSEEERQVLGELTGAGLVVERDGIVLVEPKGREPLAEALRHSMARGAIDDEPGRLAARLSFVADLTAAITSSRTIDALFHASFLTLRRLLPFDIGAAVILEENLDVYLSRGEGLEDPVSDRFGVRVREETEKLVGISFGTTDLMTRTNHGDLPRAASPGDDPYAHSVSAMLSQENRTAGLIVLFSSHPFEPEAHAMLEVLSSQLSMVLGNLRAAEKLANQADTDDLTGIWNKRWLRRQLPNEIERSRIYNIPLSLAMFDIDDFKTINDTFGHVMGDVLLSELCGTVRETLRPPDTLARFGGDEFAVILPHSDIYGARAVADRILQRARSLRLLTPDGTTELRCSVSVGIATYVPPDMTAADLLQRADERLYESKRTGKNRISW